MISLVSHGRTFNFDDGYKAYNWALANRPEWFSGLPDDCDEEWLEEIGELINVGKLSSFMTPKKKKTIDKQSLLSIFGSQLNENPSEEA